MKPHPFSGAYILIALVLVPLSLILLRFATQPDLFSKNALDFVYYITIPILSFVIFLSAQPDSTLRMIIASLAAHFLKRKNRQSHRARPKVIELPNVFERESPKLISGSGHDTTQDQTVEPKEEQHVKKEF